MLQVCSPHELHSKTLSKNQTKTKNRTFWGPHVRYNFRKKEKTKTSYNPFQVNIIEFHFPNCLGLKTYSELASKQLGRFDSTMTLQSWSSWEWKKWDELSSSDLGLRMDEL